MNVSNLPEEARVPRPPNHPRVASGRVGVLIVNLGTPEGTDYWSIRRYLQEFLSDRRVIETPRVIWAPILQAILLRRPHAKGRDYDSIWNKERNEGPLKTITRSQSEKLGLALRNLDRDVVVDWAMRYGAPPIAERLKALQAEGCDRDSRRSRSIRNIAPLRPRPSATRRSRRCSRCAGNRRFALRPPITTTPSISKRSPAPSAPVSQSSTSNPKSWSPPITASRKPISTRATLIFAIARRRRGSCAKSSAWTRDRLLMTFQSRFGRGEWLKPYTSQTLRELASRGVRRVAVLTPGFAADCLETLEEIGVENAGYFREAGGEHFAAIPCLNDSADGMAVIEAVARRELRGWAE